MTMTHAENVAKGMKKMNDTYGEGWVDDFDLDTFDITKPWKCVLGQYGGGESGDYNRELERLFPDKAYDHFALAIAHGFDLPQGAGDAAWDELQAIWDTLIREQKARRGK